MKIIIINGYPQSGKDTFVQMCKEYNENIFNLSTIDFIKNIAYKCGWNGIKDENSRLFLSSLKKVIKEYNSYYLIDLDNKINNINEENPNAIIFIHCREIQEIVYLKNKYHGNTLLIDRNKIDTSKLNNSSDKNVYLYKYDYIIKNNSDLKNLKKEAKKFIYNI